MLHKMKLNQKPFEKISNGTKTIELRLNDEKRQLVRTGDFIEFCLIDNPNKKIQTRVTDLHYFDSFAELYNSLPKEKIGYNSSETPSPHHMNSFYSPDKQNKYGVVGIELRFTDLQRFIDAQENGYHFCSDYQTALNEIKQGEKVSHWIWYVFPQIHGLGFSNTNVYFSIKGLQEAQDYYSHPLLNSRLLEITSELLNIPANDPVNVFGRTDSFKLCSCMTLFKHIAPEKDLFQKVLDKFFQGNEDSRTLKILGL